MPKLQKIITFTAAIAVILTNFLITNRPVAAQECDDVKIIFARGSGETLNDISETAWRTSLDQELQKSNLKYDFYELGSKPQKGYKYPAVPISGSIGNTITVIGAYVSAGSAFDFGASVLSGQYELKNYINAISVICPQTKFVLGGYSQGAMLITGILDNLDAEKIIYAATFGDPKLYLPEGKGFIPDACLGKNLSNYRVNVADCHAYKGILDGYEPYQPKNYIDKLGAWCNGQDAMCSSKLNFKDHTGYVSSNLYTQASNVIANKIKDTFPEKDFSYLAKDKISMHDLAILIDTTGSMSSIINTYKNEAKRLAHKIQQQGGRIALYEYRDLDEDFEPRQLCDLSCSYDEFTEKLDSLTVGGGGDEPESVLSGALHVMNTLKWQTGATKSIVLLTDASYLSPDRDNTTFEQVVQRSLEIDPVNIYTITPESLKDTYAELTSATNGQTFSIENEISLSTETISNRPNANFPLAEYYGTIGQEFTFTLNLSDINENTNLTYLWDLDGDNIFETETKSNSISKTYNQATDIYIQAKIIDKNNYTSTASAKLQVADSVSLSKGVAQIYTLETKSLTTNSAAISFTSSAHSLLLIINGAIIGKIETSKGQYIINDLTGPVIVTLIPYDKNNTRGEAKTIKLSPQIPKAPQTGTNGTLSVFGANILAPNLNDNGLHIRTYKPTS